MNFCALFFLNSQCTYQKYTNLNNNNILDIALVNNTKNKKIKIKTIKNQITSSELLNVPNFCDPVCKS